MLFLAHLTASLFMTGLIWFVQVVHYPLFSRVGGDFSGYQREHMRRTTWVVGPVMLIEAFTAAGLILDRPTWLVQEAVWVNILLLGATWASTALLQVPAHQKLLFMFDAAPHRALVRSNWIRTVLWTARSSGMLILANPLFSR